VPRFAKIRQIPPDLDQEIWGVLVASRSANIAPGFLHSGLRSHVLLAACGANELAMEVDGRGFFTQALLEVLTTVGAERITYAGLLRRIRKLHGSVWNLSVIEYDCLTCIPSQNPQCEGYNQNRILFESEAPDQNHISYDVRGDEKQYVEDYASYIISAN